MEHPWEATLHHWLSPCEDAPSQTRHVALKAFAALTLPSGNVFRWQLRTGVSTEPVPFFSPLLLAYPGCLTGGRAVPCQQ